jgi:uncharacterized membrane protein
LSQWLIDLQASFAGGALARAVVVLAVMLAAGAFLLVTPGGALAKADAIGYAVCHRIDSHSFTIAGRQLPLCARCTGIFIGGGLTIAALIAGGRGRAARMPARGMLVVLLGFIAVMGVDGLNSYLGFFHGLLPQAYTPANWLRLLTGTLDGVAMGALILPMFNGIFWREPQDAPSLRNPRELAWLLALGALLFAATLSELDVLLIPLVVLSAAGVLSLFTLVNTTILTIVLRRENRVPGWRAAVWPLLGGLAATLSMFTVIDVVRFAVTGTWGGLSL